MGRGGSRQLALSGWRSLTGGGPWRCQLAERVGGVACGGAASSRDSSVRFDARIGRFPVGRVGHLRLALSGWRSLTGGATWRCLLAEPLGGPGWRTSLAVSPVAVRFEPRLMSVLRCDDRQVPGGESWSPAVGALWLALSDWRSNLAVSVGGATRRTCLAEPLGGVSWRTTLADQLGGVTRGGVGVEPKPISTLRCEDRKVPGGARWSPAAGAL
jgi:hypothetical protein